MHHVPRLTHESGSDRPRSAPQFAESGFGSAVCDCDGRIVVATAAFRRLARDLDGIGLDARGRITASNPWQTGLLRAAIATACAERTGEEGTSWLSLARRSEEGSLLVAVEPVHGPGWGVGGAGRHALLFTMRPTQNRLALCALEAMGGLTAAELDVCRLLLCGHSTREIAAARNVSPETVRQQIKAAMAKLGCHRRADLLRLATSTLPFSLGERPEASASAGTFCRQAGSARP